MQLGPSASLPEVRLPNFGPQTLLLPQLSGTFKTQLHPGGSSGQPMRSWDSQQNSKGTVNTSQLSSGNRPQQELMGQPGLAPEQALGALSTSARPSNHTNQHAFSIPILGYPKDAGRAGCTCTCNTTVDTGCGPSFSNREF